MTETTPNTQVTKKLLSWQDEINGQKKIWMLAAFAPPVERGVLSGGMHVNDERTSE